MNMLKSKLPKQAYFAQLKGCLSSPFSVSDERMTGMVIGSWFSVAYYSPNEWNRRVTLVCSRAWGRVMETENGTEVRFIRGKGLFSPFWLLSFTLVFAAMAACTPLPQMEVLSNIFGELGTVWLTGAVLSAAVCAVTAFLSAVTEAGEYGAGEITRLLQGPGEFKL